MHPIRVGLVGTGYAARARAESFQADERAELVAVAGQSFDQAQRFAETYGLEAVETWADLAARSDLDLMVVANANVAHAAVARAALQAGKHVVVEYPLALDYAEAVALSQLAQQHHKLLHVEHIELLSGIHQAIRAALDQIGTPFYVRYTSLNAQRPAPQKWTYAPSQFGFPLIGAVSRIHRLTHLLGSVNQVNCQTQFWPSDQAEFHTSCLCSAQLRFTSGVIAELTYGKGEAIWQSRRHLEIHGTQGAIFVEGDQGRLVLADQTHSLNLGTRRGLFVKDTQRVLDYLTARQPLYVSLAESLYALHIAEAARQSAASKQVVNLASQTQIEPDPD